MRVKVMLLSGVAVTLLAAGLAVAQAPAKEPQAGIRPEANGVERRIARLESRIVELLDEVRSLRAELRGQPAPKVQPEEETLVEVFALKYAEAVSLARTLTAALPGERNGQRFLSDSRTNTIIARGTQEELRAAKDLISRLDAPGDRDKPGK